jgi:hypothetical protein
MSATVMKVVRMVRAEGLRHCRDWRRFLISELRPLCLQLTWSAFGGVWRYSRAPTEKSAFDMQQVKAEIIEGATLRIDRIDSLSLLKLSA